MIFGDAINLNNNVKENQRGLIMVEEEKDQDKVYCPECLGEVRSTNELVTINGGSFCECCVEEYFYLCDSCGGYHIKEECFFAFSEVYCEACYCEMFRSCDRCGDLLYVDDGHYTDDGCYCDGCYDHVHSGEFIQSWSYKPDPDYYGKNKLRYGIELEVERMRGNDKSCDDMAEDLTENNGNWIYFKEDGSLDNGFEIVSHPSDLEYHRSKHDWQGVLSDLAESGFRSHNTNTCGIHIHASRKHLTESQIVKIVSFVNIHRNKMARIARRDAGSYNKYKDIWQGKDLKDCCHSMDRYEAVNLINRHTIEFRIFRGTLKYSTFMATLEIVDAIIGFCGSDLCGVGYMFHSSEQTWFKFIDFLRKDRKQYKYAMKYLTDLKLL